jgi:NAD(P)-dependent dehydrogenase (short-subunit alcohol dehydrogenase family)
MTQSPANRVALVTGAAGGMGKAHVLALVRSGWTVAACDRDEAALERFRDGTKDFADKIAVHKADVTSMDDVSRVVEDASRLGPVLGVVNNAGIGSPPRPFREIPVEDWREMLEVHLIGAVHCVLATLDKMDEAGFGRIVNVSSYCAESGSVGFIHYCAAKSALIGYTMSLALEQAGRGVTVNAVAPGLVETPMTAKDTPEARAKATAKIPLGRYGRPEEVAAMIAFLASDEAAYVTGRVFGVSGGLVCR